MRGEGPNPFVFRSPSREEVYKDLFWSGLISLGEYRRRTKMRRNPFGWDLPAGAESDPNAPYNQQGGEGECVLCGAETKDEDGKPYHSESDFCSLRCETIWRRKNEPDEDHLYDEWKDRQLEEEEE